MPEVLDAFVSLAPDVLGGGPESALQIRKIDPEEAATVAAQLTSMFSRAGTPPEEAVPAAFSIGLLVGMEIMQARANIIADKYA